MCNPVEKLCKNVKNYVSKCFSYLENLEGNLDYTTESSGGGVEDNDLTRAVSDGVNSNTREAVGGEGTSVVYNLYKNNALSLDGGVGKGERVLAVSSSGCRLGRDDTSRAVSYNCGVDVGGLRNVGFLDDESRCNAVAIVFGEVAEFRCGGHSVKVTSMFLLNQSKDKKS